MSRFALRRALAALTPEERRALVGRSQAVPEAVRSTVAGIEARVRRDGDGALRELASELDRATIDALVVPGDRLKAAWEALPAALRSAMETARDTLTRFHRSALPPAGRVDEAVGLSCAWRHDPVRRAGIYVPGGRHSYPSTVLMTVVPAQVAGVPDIWLASPPGPSGDPGDGVLAAAHLLGVKNVVRAGGAQAVFALAHGTESVPRCDVVVGPGNAYVQAAKERIAGTARIDSPAGPSEVVVIADARAPARRVSAELLAQAEHGPGSFCVAIVPSDEAADAVEKELERQAARLETGATALAALADRGALLIEAQGEAQAAFASELAPEHLVVLRVDGPVLSPRLQNAGCVFLGPHASVPLGDYVAGPSHVLPTGGSARAFAGLGVETFLRRINIIHMLKPPAGRLATAATAIAMAEGFPAHAAALQEASRAG